MEEQKKDRPKVQLEIQGNVLNARWGPKKGLWGIFTNDMTNKPAEVEVKEWWLYVGGLVNQQKPDQESDQIFSESVGTKTEMMIDLAEHLKNSKYKVVVAQVIGYFDSQKIDGEPFVEGIYSNVAQKEIK